MTNPSVFLSYSHDSVAHKAWVRKLAEDLRHGGVDATLDQWDLKAGADVVAFMAAGIRRADRVLLVCTSTYVSKAEQRKGGAGYEGLIVTSQVARAIDTVKFIPLVRDNPNDPLLPDFLGPRLWLDFRDDRLYGERLEELLRELHDQPRFRKPPLGRPSFLADPAEASVPTVPVRQPPVREKPAATTAGAPQREASAASHALPTETHDLETARLRRQGEGWRVERRSLRLERALLPLGEEISLPLLWIPGGEFVMGSPPDELERSDSEGPQHRVRLAGFCLGQTPITQAQWRAVARLVPPLGERWQRQLPANPSYFQPQGEKKGPHGRFALLPGESKTEQRPVEQVSWHEAMEFCRRVETLLPVGSGLRCSLPSEAQWEYACRAGESTPFSCGETISPELANYVANDTYADGPKGKYREQTTPVGMFPANAWGLHDMHGNVWQWCADDWHPTCFGAPNDGRPWIDPGAETPQATRRVGCDPAMGPAAISPAQPSLHVSLRPAAAARRARPFAAPSPNVSSCPWPMPARIAPLRGSDRLAPGPLAFPGDGGWGAQLVRRRSMLTKR
ncbi:SUMF1/EgtB/PvdO family nonheme iron enzyme [Cyanobium sp. FGCU-6]|nr:SUMF1/EgtB/PvdO family nonheme iron enzyme [Cyanobium sp. FGCU6]